MQSGALTPFIHPDAPAFHNGERKCEDCSRKLNGYVKVQSKQSPHAGSLLCDDCIDARIDADMAVIEDQREKAKRVRAKRTVTALENLKNAGYPHRPPGFTIKGLRDLRDEMGKTQEWIGDRLGMVARHISNLERGRVKVSEKKAREIAEILGVSVEDLRG